VSTSEYSNPSSSEQPVAVDPEAVQRAKREIQGLIKEISDLSRSEVSPEDFYDGLLNKVVAALAAPCGAVWIIAESGILQLIRLCLNEKLPQRAAVLLQEQMAAGAIPHNRDNLELLAESWQLARENDKAAAAFTELATLTNDPSAYYRLGYIYFTQEKWDAASKALAAAVKNGALQDKPDAWLLLGISAYHNQETATATRALNQALNHESTRQQAQWWLNKLGGRMEQDSG